MQVLAFGDSFVKMFLHCRPTVRFVKFKGKSIKGLIKEDDEEHERVEKQIIKSPKAKHILFFFGQVDFNYVRYYKLVNNEPEIGQQVFRDYIRWVSKLNKKYNISIVSVFPSPVRQEHIINSLTSKVSYHVDNHSPENDEKIIKEFRRSKQVWEKWNSWIVKYCKINHVKNIRLFDQYEIPEEFLDLSSLNIHLRYVPVLKRVQKFIDIKFDEKKTQEKEREYEEDKINRINQSRQRMARMRDETSETTTEKEKEELKNNSVSDSSEENSQDEENKKSGKMRSQKCASDFQDPALKEAMEKPIRKKTVEVISTTIEQKTEKTHIKNPSPKKQQSNASDKESVSDEQSDDDDIGDQLLNMALGGRSRY